MHSPRSSSSRAVEPVLAEADWRETGLSIAPKPQGQFQGPRFRPDPVGSGAIGAFLDDPERGLVLIERDGRVALCSRRARLLLGLDAPADPVGRSFRRVLAELGRAWREDWGLIRTRPRGDLRRHGRCVVEARAQPITCTVKALAGAGWSVTLQERRPAAAPGDTAWGGVVEDRHDPVTGLPDRTAFRARLAKKIDRPGARLAVLAVGLDRFKQVNDVLGHAVGDAVLKTAAGRLRTALRRHDGVARLGGDTFAVMQDGNAEAPDPEPLARRIVDLIGRPYVIDGHLINIGASVGVALSTDEGIDPDALLKQAHLALDRAKRDGRATVRFFDAEMGYDSHARRSLEIDLRRALWLDQFALAYQPQLDLGSDRLVGCEALIRWNHPVRGVVSPAEFIPLAEELGLIVPIGEWVLRTACRDAALWPDDITVAVNLSPAQFRSPALVDAVSSALAASGLPPHRLELEITEGLLLQESEANLRTLNAVRDLGPRIAMDDFGTGYASLSSLRAFPFDRIKIDRSFVSGPKAERDAMAVVRAIASLGATYGMSTVAEGVETPEQMRDIRSEGCSVVQGYYIGRPMPAADITRLFVDQAEKVALPLQHRSPEPHR